jgi:hypothetical protein
LLLILQVPSLRSIQYRWAMQDVILRHFYFFSTKTLPANGEKVGRRRRRRIVHTTRLVGGSRCGVLRLALLRALSKAVDECSEV